MACSGQHCPVTLTAQVRGHWLEAALLNGRRHQSTGPASGVPPESRWRLPRSKSSQDKHTTAGSEQARPTVTAPCQAGQSLAQGQGPSSVLDEASPSSFSGTTLYHCSFSVFVLLFEIFFRNLTGLVNFFVSLFFLCA